MLEIRTYQKIEIEEILKTKSRQATTKKLDRYEVVYDCGGRGDYRIEVKEIRNPFKLYCILELEISAASDFNKLREFMYYYLCDDEFVALPDKDKSEYLNKNGRANISRQTISKWTKQLERKKWIHFDDEKVIYYFAYKDNRIETDKVTYCKAWKNYHYDMNVLCMDASSAITSMICEYGGVARKLYLPQQNVFYTDEINTIINMVGNYIEENRDF